MQKQWWMTFFNAEIGDFMFGRISAQKTASEVATILAKASLPVGSHILDLACGRGRHLLAFAKKGYRVTGLDYSKPYLAEASHLARTNRVSGRTRFVHADMRLLSTHIDANSVDLVTSLYNSFGYFRKKGDDFLLLRQIYGALKPGGMLVLNTLNHSGVEHRLCRMPKTPGPQSVDRWEQLSKTRFFLDRATYNSAKRDISVEWHFIDLKNRAEKPYRFRQNVYSNSELKSLLWRAGFKVLKTWGSLEGTSFDKVSWHQTLLAKKPR